MRLDGLRPRWKIQGLDSLLGGYRALGSSVDAFTALSHRTVPRIARGGFVAAVDAFLERLFSGRVRLFDQPRQRLKIPLAPTPCGGNIDGHQGSSLPLITFVVVTLPFVSKTAMF